MFVLLLFCLLCAICVAACCIRFVCGVGFVHAVVGARACCRCVVRAVADALGLLVCGIPWVCCAISCRWCLVGFVAGAVGVLCLL